MAIELHDYDIISHDFKALTGDILFTDFRKIPNHHRSEMLFTLTIGNSGSRAGSNFSLNVSIGPQFAAGRQGPVAPATFEYGTYDPERILSDINALIARCDRGTFQDSVDALRKVFDWEYEGMERP